MAGSKRQSKRNEKALVEEDKEPPAMRTRGRTQRLIRDAVAVRLSHRLF